MNKTLYITIPGRLPSLNEYTRANRANKYVGAKMKSESEDRILTCLLQQARRCRFTGPVSLHFHWVEKDKRRDLDNICFAKKFILDALVTAQVITDDGWSYVNGFTDSFDVDPKYPHIEITIKEVEK